MTTTNVGLNGTTNKGEYTPNTSYSKNDAVTYGGQYYIYINSAPSSGILPDSNIKDDDGKLYWTQVRQNYKTGFINNSGTNTINGLTVAQRQSLTDALKPKADN